MLTRSLILGCALTQLLASTAVAATTQRGQAGKAAATKKTTRSTRAPVAEGGTIAKTRKKPTKARAARPVNTAPARVDSEHPLPVMVLLDASSSTRFKMPGDGQVIADVLHGAGENLVESLLMYSQAGEDEVTGLPKFKPYFRVGVLRYNSRTEWLLGSEHGFLNMDDAFKAGEEVETDDPNAPPLRWLGQPDWDGYTHMGEAFAEARPVVERFVADYPNAQAPIIINVSDGQPEGGAMRHIPEAKAMQEIATKNGKAVVMNFHVSPQGAPLVFPTREQLVAKLKHDPIAMAHALTMFEMSSPLPPAMAKMAKARLKELYPDLDIKAGARSMVMNASGLMLPTLFEIGTVQAQHGVGTKN